MPKSDLAFFEGVSLAVLCGILVFDLLLVVRRSHTPSNKESALWVTLYAVLAIIFGAVHVNELPFVNGGQHIEWVPEISRSLSLGVILASVAVSAIASLLKTSNRSTR